MTSSESPNRSSSSLRWLLRDGEDEDEGEGEKEGGVTREGERRAGEGVGGGAAPKWSLDDGE